MKEVDNVRGAMWMLASAMAFTASMSLIKFLGPNYPAAMQVFFRQACGMIAILPFLARDPKAAFATKHPYIFLSRAAATSVAMILSFISYNKLPLAEANALSFSRTLWLVPLAVMFLGERVGAARIIATMAGFAGVLIILKPGAAGSIMGLPALYGLIAAILIAFSVTGMKAMSRLHGPLTLIAWSTALGVVFTLPPALLDWHSPSLRDLLLLLTMGTCGTATQYFYVRGLTLGDATVMAPVDYTRIIFTSLFGFYFFHEMPGATTWLGIVIIVGSAVFITLHAHRSAIAPVSPPA